MKKFLIVVLSCLLLTSCVSLGKENRKDVKIYNDCPWQIDVTITYWGIPYLWTTIGNGYADVSLPVGADVTITIKGVYDYEKTKKYAEVEWNSNEWHIEWSSYKNAYIITR